MAHWMFLGLCVVGAGAGKYAVLPLGYDGEYIAQIDVEGQPFKLTLDTGSSNLVIPVQQCTKCSGAYECSLGSFSNECGCQSALSVANFQPVACDEFTCPADSGTLSCGPSGIKACDCRSASGEFPFLHPELSVVVNGECYGDNSGYYGVISKNTVQIGSFKTNAYFTAYSFMIDEYACGASLNVGILGLAYKSLNSLGVPGPLAQMVKEHQLDDVFALCFPKPSSQYVEDIGHSGAFVVGGIGPSSLYTGSVHYAAVVKDEFYSVSLRDMLVNDRSLSLNLSPYNVIVDSGTTKLLLPSLVYARLTSPPNGVTNLNDVVEFRLHGLEGPDVLLRVTYADLNGNIEDGGSNFILGQPVFWNYHVVFNRTLNAVGFAQQGDCNAVYKASKGQMGTSTMIMAVAVPLLVVLGSVAMYLTHMRNKRYDQALQQTLVDRHEEEF